MGRMAPSCIYCPQTPDSREHPLPAALGEFRDAPYLKNRICKRCNNRLGLLDEQLTRCGPEALLRKRYGIPGRSTHDSVKSFERGSADGDRLDLRTMDDVLGIEVLLEVENGTVSRMRQLVIFDNSGKPYHPPIPRGSSPQELRAAFNRLGVVQPRGDFQFFCAPEETEWVAQLIKEAWPSVSFGESISGSTTSKGAVGTVGLTDRYFRAMAKIGFHYFLTQFPQYSGHEPMFSEIREFIMQDGGGVDRANDFVGKREHALLGALLDPNVRPDGWRAHVLCAEVIPGECLAYVQTFVTEDWAAPAYAVRLSRDASIVDRSATGHAYMYYRGGREGKAQTRYNASSLASTAACASGPLGLDHAQGGSSRVPQRSQEIVKVCPVRRPIVPVPILPRARHNTEPRP